MKITSVLVRASVLKKTAFDKIVKKLWIDRDSVKVLIDKYSPPEQWKYIFKHSFDAN